MFEHTKAGFRAMRELVGMSQQDVADSLGCTVLSVKHWEAPTFAQMPPQDAWGVLETERDAQMERVDACLAIIDDMDEAAPACVSLPYWRNQTHHDQHARDAGNCNVANATTRELAAALTDAGIAVRLVYPGYEDDAALGAAIALTR